MSSVQNLTELDPDKAEQKLLFVRQLVSEELPTLQVSHGVVNDLVLNPAALLAAARDEDMDRLRRANSLAAIEADPTLADDDYVDDFMSTFYLISRRDGSAARGTITIVVSEAIPTAIPSGAVFSSGTSQFRTASSYLAVTTESNQVSDTDRLLVERSDGNYAFNIDIVAVEPGVAGMLKRGTLLTASFNIQNLVTIFVESDFSGGVETETNTGMLNRLPEGLATRTLSSRTSITGVIRDSYPDVVAVSSIGFGDAEMLRDRHSVFPVSVGGRVDCYVQTSALPLDVTLTLEATLIEKTDDGKGNWQLSIERDSAAALYDIVEIVPVGESNVVGSFETINTVRGYDLTNILGQLAPDIETAAEAAFSRYQTSVVQFHDDFTATSALTVGDTADYSVTVRQLPDIAGIQALLASRATRNAAGDVLVKAPVPCFTRVSFTLEAKPGTVLPDYTQIQTALAAHVNSLGFVGRLSASELAAIIYGNITGKVTVGTIDMYGRILRPDGTVRPVRSTETLLIPYEPDSMVTPRTTLFFLDPRSVAISLRVVNIP